MYILLYEKVIMQNIVLLSLLIGIGNKTLVNTKNISAAPHNVNSQNNVVERQSIGIRLVILNQQSKNITKALNRVAKLPQKSAKRVKRFGKTLKKFKS